MKKYERHGHTVNRKQSREYKSWQMMLIRCQQPHYTTYHRYGGRGISVCNRWAASFLNFLADMGPRPSNTSLDRFPNNNGDYEPSNCRWATIHEQSANRRTTKLTKEDVHRIKDILKFRDKHSLKEVAKYFGVSRGCIASIAEGRSWRE